jgi:glycosyltransferase involved in cell wall biosynthesis
VFCLYPHQRACVVPARAVALVPDDVSPERAVLAGAVETAVNALWDAAPLDGDRGAVVGAGMVGCCVARLLAGVPRPGRADVLVQTICTWVADRALRRRLRHAAHARRRELPSWSTTAERVASMLRELA